MKSSLRNSKPSFLLVKPASALIIFSVRSFVAFVMLARRLIVFGNPNAISDGTVSALMARAALRSALYNVKINLGLIKDDEYVAAARAKMQQLEAKAMEIEAFVLARTDEVLK